MERRRVSRARDPGCNCGRDEKETNLLLFSTDPAETSRFPESRSVSTSILLFISVQYLDKNSASLVCCEVKNIKYKFYDRVLYRHFLLLQVR